MPIALKNDATQEWVIKLSLFLAISLILLFIVLEPGNSTASVPFAGDPFTFEHNSFICEIDRDTRTWLEGSQAK